MKTTGFRSTLRFLLFAVAGLAVLQTQAADRWDWHVPIEPDASSGHYGGGALLSFSLSGEKRMAPMGEGFVVVGRRLATVTVPGGVVRLGNADLQRDYVDTSERAAALPDGGVLAWDDDRSHLHVIGPDGRLRWSHSQPSMSNPLVSVDGGVEFIETDRRDWHDNRLVWTKLGRDGQVVARTVLREPDGDEMVLRSGSVVFADTMLPAGADGEERIVVADRTWAMRVRPDGHLRWLWSAGDARGSIGPVAAEPDGGALVGLELDSGNGWTLLRIEADGQTRVLREIQREGYESELHLTSTGVNYLVSTPWQPGADGLVAALDRDGNLLWELRVPQGCESFCETEILADGDLWISGDAYEGGHRMFRFGPDGARRFANFFERDTAGFMRAFALGGLSDGRMVVGLRRSIRDETPGAIASMMRDEYRVVSRDGTMVAGIFPGAPWTPGAYPPLAAHDRDGGTIALTLQAGQHVLQNYTSEGHLVRRGTLTVPQDFGRPRALAKRNEYAWVGLDHGVALYRPEGRLTPIMALAFGKDTLGSLHVFDDGRALVSRLGPPSDSDPPSHPSTWYLVAPEGDARELPQLQGAVVKGRDEARQRLLLRIEQRLFWLDADGTLTAMPVPLDDEVFRSAVDSLFESAVSAVGLPGGDVVVAHAALEGIDIDWIWSERALVVSRVSPDGQLRWQRRWTEVGRSSRVDLDESQLLANARGQLLLATRSGTPASLRLRVLSMETGDTLASEDLPCPVNACTPRGLALTESGGIRAMIGVGSETGEHGLVARDGLFDVSMQPSTMVPEGVWVTPGLDGQGFTLRHDVDTGAVLAGWFTHARSVGNAADRSRWFMLTGDFAPEGASAVLEIQQISGGDFAAGAAAVAKRIGTATLRVLACDRLLMQFRLDPDFVLDPPDGWKGGEGDLLLRPLLSAGDCTGTPLAQSPVSGVWYDTDASGQGLDLFETLGASGGASPFAGAWFTHAPSSPSDGSPVRNRWFTVRGEREPDGTFRAELLQTLSGGFAASATANTTVVGELIGRAVDCGSMSVDYRFDDSAVAGPFSGRHGTMVLRRLAGRCDENAAVRTR
jgi:hypothetical protein